MSYCYCPYCHQEIEEPYLDEPSIDTTYEHECEKCGKKFVFTIDFSIDYNESKADCLNGGEHDWKPICGCPEEVFKNRRRCSMCDKEITLKDKTAQEIK